MGLSTPHIDQPHALANAYTTNSLQRMNLKNNNGDWVYNDSYGTAHIPRATCTKYLASLDVAMFKAKLMKKKKKKKKENMTWKEFVFA